MFSKIMVLAATASFIALTAPHDVSFAQTPTVGRYESIDDLRRRHRKEDCDRYFREGWKYLELARIGKEEADKLRKLEKTAQADTKSDGEYAKVLGEVAWANENQAMDDLDRAKAAFALAECTDPVINALVYFAIDKATLLIYPSARPKRRTRSSRPRKRRKSLRTKSRKRKSPPRSADPGCTVAAACQQSRKARSAKQPPTR